MIGFILAAGFGTRLRPITDHVPKALVPVAGRPLLSWSLDYCNDNGMSALCVNTHYLPELMESFHTQSSLPFTLFHEKDQIRGTGGALYFARDFLAADETFCVTNVDIINTVNLKPIIKKFKESNKICTLVAVPSNNDGTIYFDMNTGDYLGTPSDTKLKENMGMANFVGITLYKKKVLDLLLPDDFSIIAVWRRLLDQGNAIGVELTDGYWRDIGTPAALAGIHFDIIDKTVQLAIPSHLQIDHERHCCYCKSLGNTPKQLSAYAWVETAIVPENCRIERSVIFDNAHLAEKTDVINKLVTPWGAMQF